MVTGHGLKTVEALADVVGPTATIAPTLDVVRRGHGGRRPRTHPRGAPMIKVRIPAQLRTLTGGVGEVPSTAPRSARS